MLSEVLRVAVYGMDHCLQNATAQGIYDPSLRRQIMRVRQDLKGLEVLLTTTERASDASQEQVISVTAIAEKTLRALAEYGESPASVGGVSLHIHKADRTWWNVEVAANYPFDLPAGCGPVHYDTSAFPNARVAFLAVLAAAQLPVESKE